VGCGACCIFISISSPMPEMPFGKAAGERCRHLTREHRCSIWGTPDYPDVCRNFKAERSICGTDFLEAEKLLRSLEEKTRPDT
jgi:Fe-S-cluster containining protein